jgi:hypothetical protein
MDGPSLTRARVGLRPTRPQHVAGIRMEPPASLPWAIGTIPLATAAAEPPLEPLVDLVVSQGLRVGPYASASQVGNMPNSGVAVLPMTTSPAAFSRRTSSESYDDTCPARKREPSWKGVPAISTIRSLSR